MTNSKFPKFWRSRFFSAFYQIGVDPDRSLIQGDAFTRHRKITLPLAARLIASLSSASVRQHTHTFCKKYRISFTESAFCLARQKFDHASLKDASLDFAGQVSAESSLHKGKYRLIGLDGSSFPILPNPEELQNLVELSVKTTASALPNRLSARPDTSLTTRFSKTPLWILPDRSLLNLLYIKENIA